VCAAAMKTWMTMTLSVVLAEVAGDGDGLPTEGDFFADDRGLWRLWRRCRPLNVCCCCCCVVVVFVIVVAVARPLSEVAFTSQVVNLTTVIVFVDGGGGDVVDGGGGGDVIVGDGVAVK